MGGGGCSRRNNPAKAETLAKFRTHHLPITAASVRTVVLWRNSSNAKIAIRSAFPRNFVEKFLGKAVSAGVPSSSGVFENHDAAVVQLDFGGFPC
jgi:hypothetical protein